MPVPGNRNTRDD